MDTIQVVNIVTNDLMLFDAAHTFSYAWDENQGMLLDIAMCDFYAPRLEAEPDETVERLCQMLAELRENYNAQVVRLRYEASN